MESSSIAAIADAIRLSVAPVFLLAGLGGMLMVMTNRLGRTVDRARALTERIAKNDDVPPSIVTFELSALSRRSGLINFSITMCAFTACLICSVIVALFLGAFLKFNMATAVAVLFIAAMFTYLLGLLSFVREIFVARATFRAWKQTRIPEHKSED